LWWWCLDYAETGSLADFNNDDIADAAAWEGDPDTFVSALLNCGPADRPGFLIDTGAGLTVNDWDEYGGKYVTKRNQGRERQRTYRQRNAVVTRDSSVSNTTREDKSIVEERKEQNHQTNGRGSAEDALIDPELAQALGKWKETFTGTPYEANPPIAQLPKWLAYAGAEVMCYMIGKAKDKDNPGGYLFTTFDNWRKDGEVAPYVVKAAQDAKIAEQPIVMKTVKVDYGDGTFGEVEVQTRGT